jgi:adenosine deaminase
LSTRRTLAGVPPQFRNDPPSRDDREAFERILRLPKIELHLHVEGSIREDTATELARRYDPDSPFAQANWSRGYWHCSTLSEFLVEFRRMTRACIRTTEDMHRVASECFEDLAAQNVVYVEVNVGVRPQARPYAIPQLAMLRAVDAARRDVESRFPIRIGLIVATSTDSSLQGEPSVEAMALEVAERAVLAREEGIAVVGLDLQIAESSDADYRQYAPAFELARRGGLGLRAHAGEVDKANVRRAMDILDVDRIGHGIRAAHDDATVAHLVETGVMLDLCPMSNIRIASARPWPDYPLRALRDRGVRVSISTDDPIAFDTSMTGELFAAHRAGGLPLSTIGAIQADAARSAFLPAADRQGLLRRIESAWPGSPHDEAG